MMYEAILITISSALVWIALYLYQKIRYLSSDIRCLKAILKAEEEHNKFLQDYLYKLLKQSQETQA